MEPLDRECVVWINAFSGYINTSDAWDYPSDFGAGRVWLMDIRFRDVIAHRYNTGNVRLTLCIPDLYKGNILSKGHFSETSLLPPSFPGISLESWPNGLAYVRLAKDPQSHPECRGAMAKFFNFRE